MSTKRFINQENFERLFESLQKECKVKPDNIPSGDCTKDFVLSNLEDIGGYVQDAMSGIKRVIYYRTKVGYLSIVTLGGNYAKDKWKPFDWYLDNSLMDLEFSLVEFHKFLKKTYTDDLEFWIGDNLDKNKPFKNIIHRIDEWLSENKKPSTIRF